MIRIGTCSWKYDSWKGIVYSEGTGINYLKEYSTQFNTVEIDQWFWSLFQNKKVLLPKVKDAKIYNESVPDDFRFTIKVPNSLTLTHFYSKNKSEPLKPNQHFLSKDLFEAFLQNLKPMESKIGALMFQFEYLNKQKLNGLYEFIERFENFITKVDRKYIIGIEIRNPNYLKKPYFEFLNKNNLSMVFLQGYYMPPVWDVFSEFKERINTTAIIRLHGPDRSGIEKKTSSIWNQIVEPKDSEIEKTAEIIQYLENKKVDTYVNVNNHFEGSAPLTIKKLKTKIE